MTSRWRHSDIAKKSTSLYRFGRRLGNVVQQVMLNKLALTFQVIYDVTMTSQRYCEKGASLYRFERRLGLVWQQVILNKLALTFQVIYDVTMTVTAILRKRRFPVSVWKETWPCLATSHIKQIGIDISGNLWRHDDVTAILRKGHFPVSVWKETWHWWTTSHVKQIGIDIPGNLWRHDDVTAILRKGHFRQSVWKETWHCLATSHVKQIGIDIPGNLWRHNVLICWPALRWLFICLVSVCVRHLCRCLTLGHGTPVVGSL